MTWQNRLRRALPPLMRIALGAVFAYAAWLKLRDPWQLFAGAIGNYKVLPDGAVIPLARTLPPAELVIGLLLIAGRWMRTASTACTLLLAGFFTLMIRAFSMGMEINCGCFGTTPGEDIISWKTLARDGSLLALSIAVTWIAFAAKRKKSAVPVAGEAAPPAG
jgi:putative oxidoreductase